MQEQKIDNSDEKNIEDQYLHTEENIDIESKKYCNHIIGEAEIQNIYTNLEKFDPPIFDQSRRMELSKDNKYVVILRNFIANQLIDRIDAKVVCIGFNNLSFF